MSLKLIFLCFFLAVKTSRGFFFTNCTTEKHHLLIVKYDEQQTIERDSYLKTFLKSFESNNVTDFERVQVTCIKPYNGNCDEGCNGILPDYKFPFNISCIPAQNDEQSIDLFLEVETISVLIGVNYMFNTYIVHSVLFSKHTFLLSNNPVHEYYRYMQGLTWVDLKSPWQHHYSPICTECRLGWTSFVEPITNTISSCYFVHHFNYTEVDMNEAGQKCKNMGADMVTIETEEEFQFVQDLLKKTLDVSGPETGCRQQNNSVCLALNLTRHGEHFRWGQGRPLVISPPRSPNLEESGDCVTWVLSRDASGYSKTWRQVDCNVTERFVVICEVETFIKRNPDYITIGPEFVIHNNNVVSVSPYLEDDTFYHWFRKMILYPVERFKCEDGSFKSIAYSFVCNNIHDCPNGRDEECYTRDKKIRSSYNVNDRNVKNTTKHDKNQCHELENFESTPHFNLTWLMRELCNSQAEDLGMFKNINNITSAVPDVPENCTLSSLWSDILACSKCPAPVDTIGSNQTMTCHMAPKCLYIKSCEGDVIGCQHLIHLQNCTTYKCPSGYSKCPMSYCIPETYVNDGTQDCPQGEDENNLMFKCFNTSRYVFLQHVCDGFKDCREGDDEINCHVECSNGFKCVAGTAIVSIFYSRFFSKYTSHIDDSVRFLQGHSNLRDAIVFNVSNINSKLITLQFERSGLKSNNFLIIPLENTIKYAEFRYNSFTEITSTGSFSKMKILQTLDLSYNTELTTFSLSIHSLESLDLSYTIISSLDRKTFENMRKLKVLNLVDTKLTNLNFIPDGFTLEKLDISGTNMQGIGSNYFNKLNITGVVRTSQYKLCCPQALGPNIPVEKCESKDKSISSCTDLVRDVSMRKILWAIGLLALLGNVFALTYRMIWDRKVLQTVYGQFVSNLCISDMIMGFYLIIIGVADEVYRDNYFAREDEWKSGVVCQNAGFLSTLSSEVTTFFICLITLDRFLTLRFQTGKYRFTTRTKRASIILSWLLGFSLALVPVLCPEWGIFTSNSMCLAFPLDTNLSGGRYYTVALFLGLNFLLFLSIIVGQIFILRSLSARRTVSTFSTVNNLRRIQDVLVARQLSLVAVTNFLAWVPVQVMGTLALAGVELDNDVYTWTAVFVLPLNSALNPLVYSFPRLYNLFLSLKNSCRK